MIAGDFWHIEDLDDFGLWVLRLSLMLFGLIAIYRMHVVWAHRSGWTRIPRRIRWFAKGWLFAWTAMAAYIWITGSNPFGEWFRTIYGSAYLGMLWGLAWLIDKATEPCPRQSKCELHDTVVDILREKLGEEVKNLEDVGITAERERGKN